MTPLVGQPTEEHTFTVDYNQYQLLTRGILCCLPVVAASHTVELPYL